MTVVIINGCPWPSSGKDTFCKFCKDYRGNYVTSISTVDYIKVIAINVGWNGKKTPEARKFLSDLKDLTIEFTDFPFVSTVKRVNNFFRDIEISCGNLNKAVIFIHSREPEEIERFKKELNAITLLIRRPEVENQEQSNHADANYLDYNYDYIIINDGTLDDLKEKARKFLIEISGKIWFLHKIIL